MQSKKIGKISLIILLAVSVLFTTPAYAGGIKPAKLPQDFEMDWRIHQRPNFLDDEDYNVELRVFGKECLTLMWNNIFCRYHNVANANVTVTIYDGTIETELYGVTAMDGSVSLSRPLYDLPLDQWYNTTITAEYNTNHIQTDTQFYLAAKNPNEHIKGTPHDGQVDAPKIKQTGAKIN